MNSWKSISHIYASDLSVKILSVTVSGAIHLSGILSWREDTYSGVSLERPKSDILSSFPSSTRMLRQARSRWRTPREERYISSCRSSNACFNSYTSSSFVCMACCKLQGGGRVGVRTGSQWKAMGADHNAVRDCTVQQ